MEIVRACMPRKRNQQINEQVYSFVIGFMDITFMNISIRLSKNVRSFTRSKVITHIVFSRR